MAELLAIAFLGGFITGVSPCIVPVLPVVVAGGSVDTGRLRPFLIIAGLVVSFSVAELLGATVLSALHLPQDLLFWLGIALLLILAVGLMIPIVGELIERPFSRFGATSHASSGGGFIIGLSLGLVFIPCAGPVLAAISVAAANHRVSASSLFVTLFYTIGAALPLLFLLYSHNAPQLDGRGFAPTYLRFAVSVARCWRSRRSLSPSASSTRCSGQSPASPRRSRTV